MNDLFKEYLIGIFSNKAQAFKNPSRYAHIRVTHVDIGDGLIYGEQAYDYQLGLPYRQFVLEPKEIDDRIVITNYSIKEAQLYRRASNLDKLKRENLEVKKGCNTIFSLINDDFIGGTHGCECYVNWRGKNTFLSTQIQLNKTHYYVIDKGICVKTQKQIWGSRYGRFEFTKLPL